MSSSDAKTTQKKSDSFDPELDQAIVEYLRAKEKGELFDIPAFLAKYSRVADSLQEFLSQQSQLNRMMSPVRQFTGLLGATDEQLPVEFSDYELIRVIGRGGMGVIYEARHQKLKRLVALKMIACHDLGSGNALRRFQAEAEAAATLEHPNIVPIYEVGHHDDRPYFTMKLVGGGSLKEALVDGPLDTKTAAKVAHSIANAIHYAHQRGVLHRDLKPANILLDSKWSSDESSGDRVRAGEKVTSGFGLSDSSSSSRRDSTTSANEHADQQIVPMISDFGLAKRLDVEEGLTMTGAVLGTPSFMSPEQASGTAALTTATDIYGVGAILYNMLSGVPPFVGATHMEITQNVIQRVPENLRKSNSNVDLDLETICLKCLEKKPQHRYETAGMLADDLRRYLKGETILARRSSPLEQVVKWARRKPAIAGLLTVVALSAVLLIAGQYLNNRVIRGEQDKTLAALKDVQKQQSETSRALWQSYLNEAKGHRESQRAGHLASSLAAIENAVALTENVDVSDQQKLQMRSEMIADLAIPVDVTIEKKLVNSGITSMERLISFDDSMTMMTAVQNNNDVLFRDVASGEVIRRLPLNVRTQAKLSPDGKFLVADDASSYQLFFCRSSGEGEVIKTEFRRSGINHTFSPDSRLLVIADPKSKLAAVYESESGKRIRDIKLINNATCVVFSPSGKFVVATNGAGQLIVVDFETGEPVFKKNLGFGKIAVADFNPAEDQLVVAGAGRGSVLLFDIRSERQVKELKSQSGFMQNVKFDSSGRFILGTDWSRTTRIWEASSGELVFRILNPMVAISQTNSRIAFRDGDEITISNLAVSEFFWHERGHELGRENVKQISFHPRLPLAVSGGGDGVRIVHTESQQEIAYLPIGNVAAAMFHPTDESLVTWGGTGLLRWPSTRDEFGLTFGPFERLPAPEGLPDEMDISRNGKTLAASLWHRPAFAIDWDDQSRFTRLGQQPGASRISVSPDGRSVAVGNWKGNGASIWNSSDGTAKKSIKAGNFAFPIFSHCGRFFACASPDHTAIYQADDLKLIGRIPSTKTIPAFSEDGSTIAIVDHSEGSRAIKLFDTRTQQRLATLAETPEIQAAHSLTFGPNGRLLGQASGVQGVSFWRLDRVREELAGFDLDWQHSGGDISEEANDHPEFDSKVATLMYPRQIVSGQEIAIELSANSNWEMSDNLIDGKTDFCFEAMPQGWVDFNGVHFQITDKLVLLQPADTEAKPERAVVSAKEVGKALLDAVFSLRDQSSQTVVNINFKGAKKLHFLHSLVKDSNSKCGQMPLRYVIHFDDKSHSTFAVERKRSIVDCRNESGISRMDKGMIAWIGLTNQRELINVTQASWINPSPDKTITSIEIQLADDANCKVLCLAMTAELAAETNTDPED